MLRRVEAIVIILLCAVLVTGCTGDQSVLDPRGEGARDISRLASILLIGGIAVLIVVVICLTSAIWGSDRMRRMLGGDAAILAGGIAFPAVVLTMLLTYGVLAMAPLNPGATPLKIVVEGKQWWWRVRYERSNGSFETANEIRIPVGRTVEFQLASADVIHSFWVPSLAGKLDMIPGRTTKLTVRATETGTMRGQCAEFCGGPHGLMSLRVIAMQPDAFDTWIAKERRRDATRPGHMLFTSAGCGGCHTIQGTGAEGRIGPDLTDVGTRAMLAAETIANTPQNAALWISSGKSIKPENKMPEFKHLSPGELKLLGDYLASLK